MEWTGGSGTVWLFGFFLSQGVFRSVPKIPTLVDGAHVLEYV